MPKACRVIPWCQPVCGCSLMIRCTLKGLSQRSIRAMADACSEPPPLACDAPPCRSWALMYCCAVCRLRRRHLWTRLVSLFPRLLPQQRWIPLPQPSKNAFRRYQCVDATEWSSNNVFIVDCDVCWHGCYDTRHYTGP